MDPGAVETAKLFLGNRMGGNNQKNQDPLLQLFEQFLVTRSYENAAEFTRQLAEEYMLYLDSTTAHVPFEARAAALEDFASEAHEMLVKKLYGCASNNDHQNYGAVVRISGKSLMVEAVSAIQTASRPVPKDE